MTNLFLELLSKDLVFKTTTGFISPQQVMKLPYDPVYVRKNGELVKSDAVNISDMLIALNATQVPKVDDNLSFLSNRAVVTNTADELRFNFLKEAYLYLKEKAEAIANAKEIKEHNAEIDELLAEVDKESRKKLSREELLKLKK